jgi:hypothetical protein
MDVLESQLSDIREAYATGRIKPMVEISDRNPLQDLKLNLYTPISPVEQTFMSKCARYRETALQATRRGEYALADSLLAEARKCMQAPELSPQARLFLQSAQEAANAYLDYRREDFESGIARIYRSLFIDEMLEVNYGYVYLFMHRIRLLLNLLRLKRRQNEEAEVLRMGFTLADYLEQKLPSLPFPTSWDAGQLNYLSLEQKTFFFEQAMAEIILLVAGRVDVPEDFVYSLTEHTSPKQSMHGQLSLRSHSWLQARLALQAEDHVRFLELVHPLISAGSGDFIWLWYGTVVDLVILCSKLSLNQAHLLLQDIVGDMASWKWSKLPPSWRLVFEKISVPAKV